MNVLDRTINYFWPEWGVRRALARTALDQIRAYDAGKTNRLTNKWLPGDRPGNPSSLGEVNRLRQRAWDLAENNPYAKRAVRSILNKTVGVSLRPQSLASIDGKALPEFRRRAASLWKEFGREADANGLPGRGGLDLTGLTKSALKEAIVTGENLPYLQTLSRSETRRRGKRFPLAIQLIESERLADSLITARPDGANRIFRGIEFTPAGDRAAYWVYPAHPADPQNPTAMLDPKRLPAADVVHLFIPERPGARRGASWLAPIILRLKNCGDYEDNEQLAAAISSCIVGAIKSSRPGALGTLNAGDTSSLTDVNGNPITRLQPGLLMKLGRDDSFEGFNPARPNAGVSDFANHLLRGTAAGLPGVKFSTISGDFRNSSFSSERSADNETWPDIEELQNWLATSFLQPLWERFLDVCAIMGLFNDLVRPETFHANFATLSACDWNGPVPRSLNPLVDASASASSIRTGTSSLPIEAAANGFQWEDLLDQMADVYRYAESIGLPPSFIAGIFGALPSPSAQVVSVETGLAMTGVN